MKIAVLGGGPGGYVAAIKAAQSGAEVYVIEDAEVGGTCLNKGCIPTKALVASAEMLRNSRNLSDFGIDLNGSAAPNLEKIMERKYKVVSTQVKGIHALFKSWGITLIKGKGILSGPDRIEVLKHDGTVSALVADRIIVATGSRPFMIPVIPFDGERILSSDEALNLKTIPKSLIIIGAGVIGCEFACIFNEFGTDVTLVEKQSRALSTEDTEISELFERELRKKKIKLITGTSIARAENTPAGIRAILSDGKELEAEKILISVGRTLNSDNLGLEALGIKKGLRGEISVNERMETNIRGIYAAGDVVGGMLLAHVAANEGIAAAENACGKNAVMDYSVVPAAVFTSPEIASVGISEKQAVERGIKAAIGRFQFRALGKAHAIGEITGFIKIIAEADTDRILGAHIIGPHASDLIHELALAIKTGLKTSDIVGTIHAHPTLSEAIVEACEDIHGRAVHAPIK